MLIDFFATFFAGSMSLLPIFADQVLKVGPHGYGWLRAAPGIGAAIGSAFLAVRSLPRRQGPVFLWAVAAYGAATVAFTEMLPPGATSDDSGDLCPSHSTRSPVEVYQ